MNPEKLENEFASLLLKNDLLGAEKHLATTVKAGIFHGARLLNLQGLLARSKGEVRAAENYFLDAIQDDRNFVPALSNLAGLYISQGRYKEALVLSRLAYDKTNPKTLAITMPLVTALLDSAKVDEAIALLDALPRSKAMQRDPLLARSACYRQKGEFEKAKRLIDQLVLALPTDPTVLRVKADLEGELGQVDPLPLYEQAMEAAVAAGKTNMSALRWNMSLHLLRARSFSRGWEYYEDGLSNAVGTLGRPLPPQFKNMPRADLCNLDSSKWTFVVVEQGIGDQVLFLSAMNEALNKFAKIALICEERLKPILKRSFPSLVLLSSGVIEFLPFTGIPTNGFVPLGALFGHFRPSLESFLKNRRPFLSVNRYKFERYRSILRERAGTRPIVGLSWKGGFWENQQRNKAVDLSAWESVLKQAIFPVSLQYGDISKDLEWAEKQGYEVSIFPKLDFKRDIDDWMAIAAACDGIISVSTALVHFAGACNQKVAVVMPEKKGPWILGIDDKRSIVYPNVHYFRRDKSETTDQLLTRVARIIR